MGFGLNSSNLNIELRSEMPATNLADVFLLLRDDKSGQLCLLKNCQRCEMNQGGNQVKIFVIDVCHREFPGCEKRLLVQGSFCSVPHTVSRQDYGSAGDRHPSRLQNVSTAGALRTDGPATSCFSDSF